MKIHNFTKLYDARLAKNIAAETKCFVITNNEIAKLAWANEITDDDGVFVIMDDLYHLPHKHPYSVLKTRSFTDDMISLFAEKFGPQAYCYDDFHNDEDYGFFMARSDGADEHMWYYELQIVFRSAEDGDTARAIVEKNYPTYLRD